MDVHAHFALPHTLVSLPEVAKILAALPRYTGKMEMVAKLCSGQPLHVPVSNYPRSTKAQKQKESNVCVCGKGPTGGENGP